MGKLPVLSGKEMIKIIQKSGFEIGEPRQFNEGRVYNVFLCTMN